MQTRTATKTKTIPKARAVDDTPQIVPPRSGVLHVIDATRYSIAGFRRLMQETAARLELVGALAVVAALVWRGSPPAQWVAAGVLFAVLLAVEALNTAIEELVDRVSPEWSLTARHAKDLGSLAVGLLLTANGLFFGALVFGLI